MRQARALLESVCARHLELARHQRLALSMTQALAVVPPMSNDSIRDSPARRASRAAANAPAAGPDSTRRIGARLAVSGVAMPPEDSMM